MWTIDFNQTGSRIALLIGQFFVLLLCLGFVSHVYYDNILPDKEAKENFVQTDCFLISKKLNIKGFLIKRYRADFLVSYNVNGAQYSRWVTGNGLDTTYLKLKSNQEDLLSQFLEGGTYPCWYNPATPEIVVLVMRHNWLSTFPLIIPSVIGVITIYYFFTNLFIIIGILKSRTQ